MENKSLSVDAPNKEQHLDVWNGACDGCGKAPRRLVVDKNNTQEAPVVVPLQRCSRCKSVLYHDEICQRNHWKQHRKLCRQLASAGNQGKWDRMENKKNSAGHHYRVEERKGRGKCLLASRTFSPGERISSSRCAGKAEACPCSSSSSSESLNDTHLFLPMVPPVLNEAHRLTHCAYCFGRLPLDPPKANQVIVGCQADRYPVLLCSQACHDACQYWGSYANDFWLTETAAVSRLCQEGTAFGPLGPPAFLATAMLLYRILLAISWGILTWKDDILSMDDGQDKSSLTPSRVLDPAYEESRRHHELAVYMTVTALASKTSPNRPEQRSALTSLATPSRMQDILSRIKVNAFTMLGNDESDEGIGVGLFQYPAHCINHSCRPNAMQRFAMGVPGQLPGLCITAFPFMTDNSNNVKIDIQPGDEICVSYIDTQRSKGQRQESLLRDYGFLCQCDRCLQESES